MDTADSSPQGRPGAASSDEWPAVSVISPVLNEARHLREVVEHVLAQDYPGDMEVILALGPSRDDTGAIAARLAAGDPRVRTVPNPSGRTPNALNAALKEARYPVVARVDGHALLPPDYLRVAVETLRRTGADNVGGIMAAEGTTSFERAVARAMTSRIGVGGARFHTGGDEGPADTVYLGVFRREAIDRVGGYDESFTRAQDWEMNHRIRREGGLVWFTPRLRVAYRPRASLKALARQYFQYGRWRRVVMREHPETRFNPRYLAPPLALLAVAAGFGLVALGYPLGMVAPLGYAGSVLGGSLYTGRGLRLGSRLWLPAVISTMHGAWAMGFLTSTRALGVDRAGRR